MISFLNYKTKQKCLFTLAFNALNSIIYLLYYTKTYIKLYNIIKRGIVMSESLSAVFYKLGGIMRTVVLKREGFYY